MNLFNKFNRNFRAIDDKSLFILHGGNKISYKNFYKCVNDISSGLTVKGIKEGDNVAILSDNNPDFILITFSLWKLKAVPVPINIKLLSGEIEEQIAFADCKFVLINKNLQIKITKHTSRIIHFPFKYNAAITAANKKYNKKETALLMFTSGSSGKSKAVILTFENLMESFRIGNQILNQNENDRWLASLPFYHIGGFSIFIRTYLAGASVIIPDSLKIEDIIIAIKSYKPSLASFVSAQLQELIKNNIKPNKELRNILIGGGFTSEELSLKAVKKGWKITKVYGSTEVSSFVSAITYNEIINRPGSSGKALYPNKISIVNENKEIMPGNVLGEVIVKSPAVTKGYYKNPEETLSKLINKFYYTGDIGFKDKDGYLFIEARRNDLIVSGGENILPKEVESVILTHPFVKDVFIFGIEHNKWGQEVSAAIVLRKDKKIVPSELKIFLKNKLPSYKIPRKIFFINEIPRSTLGKVQKEKLLNSLLTN